MAEYPGIDYGRGMVNIDHETGIRYGVIPVNSDVCQAWCEESRPIYIKGCPECGATLNEDDDVCDCGHEHGEDWQWDDGPEAFIFEEEGYKCYQSGDDTDIFIKKSPYFTYAQFCSPCAPGACHLGSPLKELLESNKCYCFGHDWFSTEIAPYPVYSVETGKLVEV